ncbi:MAG: hypothetical protein IH595_09320 [Bacteroidales bacterium]|nr:hypothetical protein [Bacteroidales bacterium]
MSLSIQEVKTLKQQKEFVELPFSIYKNNPYWVPPIKADELKLMDKKHNPAMEFCDSKFWLAYRDGKVVGRLCGIINHKYNEKVGKKLGRFSRMEVFEDHEAFLGLMDTAVAWLKAEGMSQIHGPLGYTNLDNQGLLIEGFDYLTSVASVYHMPYYQEYINGYGFEKEIDWLEFRLKFAKDTVDRAIRGAEIVKKRYGIEVKKFKKVKEIIPYMQDLFGVLNQAYERLPFVVPFNQEMINMYAKKYFKVINPKYVCLAQKNGETIAFWIAVPSMSKALQKANGKLFPFGFYHIMKAMKKPDVLDFFLAGVKPEFESQGAIVILYTEIQNQMLKDGIEVMETTGNLENNHNVIANWKNFDHIQHKRRRCYIMDL